MTEVWKDVPHFAENYEVSNFGRVRNKRTLKILIGYISERGYLKVQLCRNGKKKNERVHRLVAMAFLDNPNNYPEVNHKDGNKLNNHLENLEWCDRQYNQIDWMTRTNFIPPIKKPKKVLCGTKIFNSIQHCADYYGIPRSKISKWLKEPHTQPNYFKEEGFSFI